MKGEINNNTIIVGDFNTPLTPMDRSTKQKINKETQTLNDTTDQLDLIDIYMTFHPKTMNFIFFSSTHGTFSRIDHILGHKSSRGKFKKIEIIPSILTNIFLNGLPLWLSSKESVSQSRRRRFDPWVGKFAWRGKWQATTVFLPGKTHGQRSLEGYSPWSHESQKTVIKQ